jgi:uncharacterized protein YoxC
MPLCGRQLCLCGLLLALSCLSGCRSFPWRSRGKVTCAPDQGYQSEAVERGDSRGEPLPMPHRTKETQRAGEEGAETKQDSRFATSTKEGDAESGPRQVTFTAESIAASTPLTATDHPPGPGELRAGGNQPQELPPAIKTKGTGPRSPQGIPLPGGHPGETSLPDPHQRTSPTAAGSLFNMGPGESPMEKAIELSRQLNFSQAERKVLFDRVREQQEAVQNRDRILEDVTREVKDATTEVENARAAVRDAGEDIRLQRTRLAATEKEMVETLKSILLLLEKLETRERTGESLLPRP